MTGKIALLAMLLLVAACGPLGPKVESAYELRPLTPEQMTRIDPRPLNLNQDLNWYQIVLFDVRSGEDPTGSVTAGENTYRYDETEMTIQDSTDGKAYVIIHQDFPGGARTGITFIIPPGEKDKYLRIYKFGS